MVIRIRIGNDGTDRFLSSQPLDTLGCEPRSEVRHIVLAVNGEPSQLIKASLFPVL